jgi:hypothetical protein
VWHREPNGRDSGEVCKEYRRVQDANGDWQYKFLHAWKLHVHHWHLQVSPLQHLRRRLLTRCAWCGGRQGKQDPVNISHQWDGARGRWWQGEAGLFHHDCSSVERAHAVCLCPDPICPNCSRTHGPYGRCARCGKGRSFGTSTASLERQRLLATIPIGQRDAAIYQRICDMATAEQVAS